ncbi:uncharacterized protein LOC120630844 [Pararge aegeria]|uniref:Jg17401 protein n=1 Tax=Pararge aegeria aegeria TaxID=348720 RepID=A0A8S4RXH0_9NEOP|nr:uncharacterized protein LOC120630844 [Pararge aegeria]CAH2243298.1 jg17401 [Pararge aegeria aegeria]
MNSSPIDVDELINAVRARPPLYSRNERYEPGHRHTKKRLWLEVCKEVNPGFNELSATEKRDYDREVYKRWRSLRTCFTRELALQRREKLEKSSKRRKRYEHYDALKFMLAEYGDDTGKLQDDTMEILQYDSDDESAENGDAEDISSRSDAGTLRHIKSEVENYPETEIFFDTNNPIQDSAEENAHDMLGHVSVRHESDSDKLFMLSLIPSFRRINPRKKLAAKIELMKVMQSFQED